MSWLNTASAAVLALAIMAAPVALKADAKKEATKKAQAASGKSKAKKKQKEVKMEKKEEAKAQEHREHQEGGAWICKLASVPPPGHACTFRSHTPGKCGWCGGEMVKVEELEKEKKN